MFKITTDSTADLSLEYLKEQGIDCMAVPYIIDDVTYGEGNQLDWKEFYRLMREEEKMPTTSQINPADAKEYFEKYIRDSKEILHIAFTSGMSGTYNSARMAAEEVMEEHPDVKIIVLDSLCASMGEGLLVHKAVKMRDAGKSLEETAQWLQDHVLNLAHLVTVDDLFHLCRGGRVSKTSAIVGSMVGIKPMIHVNDEGKLIVVNKVRGRKKSIATLVQMMEAQMGSWAQENKEDYVFISHGDCLEDAQLLQQMIQEKFGFENFMINNIGPTIGSHSGCGTLALFFMGENR